MPAPNRGQMRHLTRIATGIPDPERRRESTLVLSSEIPPTVRLRTVPNESTTNADASTFTLPDGDAQTPAATGTYCYNAAYSGDPTTKRSPSSRAPSASPSARPVPPACHHHLAAAQGDPARTSSVQPNAAGGTAPNTWGHRGARPPGLHLSSSGLLSGTPTRAGTFTITVKVHDSTPTTHEKASKSLE
jgi:hypothetical protein